MPDDTAALPTSCSATELSAAGGSDSSSHSTPRRPVLKSVQPYKTQDEYVVVMKEDLAEWLNGIYDLDMTDADLFDRLEDGVLLCRHVNYMNDVISQQNGNAGTPVVYRDKGVQLRSFQARVNVAAFLAWCRHPPLKLPDTLLFETADLVCDASERNERQVALCLLEVGRRGALFGLPAPELVMLEREIDNEIREAEAAAARGLTTDDDGNYDENGADRNDGNSDNHLNGDGDDGSDFASSSSSLTSRSDSRPVSGINSDGMQVDDSSASEPPSRDISDNNLADACGVNGESAAVNGSTSMAGHAGASPARRSGLRAPTAHAQQPGASQRGEQQGHQSGKKHHQQQKQGGGGRGRRTASNGREHGEEECDEDANGAAKVPKPQYVWQRHKFRPNWDVDMMSLDEMVRMYNIRIVIIVPLEEGGVRIICSTGSCFIVLNIFHLRFFPWTS